MILSTGFLDFAGWLVGLALLAYGWAAWPWPAGHPALRASGAAWGLALTAHLVLLASQITGFPEPLSGQWRLGFGPVWSLTVGLVLLVHVWERRFLNLARVRTVLGCLGISGVLIEGWFPGEWVALHSAWSPWHWAVGVAAYGLLASAVVHALLLDHADRGFRRHRGFPSNDLGMPLMQLERLTFRFVQWGFAALSASIVMGVVSAWSQWQWNHKTVLSLLGWALVGVLLLGRYRQGWRGRQATRWLYGASLVLLLAYVGSRFVVEVILRRPLG